MAKLSREQVAKHLYDAGLRGDDLVNLVAIAGRESGYKSDAHRSDQPKGKLSGDRGLFQINSTWDKQLMDAGIINSKSDLFDPAINAKAAAYVLGKQGYYAWGMGPGNTGWAPGGDPFHKTNMGAAQTAVANFLGNPEAFSGGSTTVANPKRNTEYDPKYEPPKTDPAAQKSLTDMLSGFGVKYPDAPRATPALLTFLRGLGMTQDVALDDRDAAIGTLEGRAADARSDLERESGRRQKRIASDAEGRGALVSGATNTMFAEEAEDAAAARADIERALAEGVLAADRGLARTEDDIRQRALETTIGEEQRQAREEAEAKEQERQFKSQLDTQEYWFEKTTAADRNRVNSITGALGGY